MDQDFLLLTATVRPNVDTFVTVTDPALRLAQYRSAIGRWADTARSMGFGLVVAETSGEPAQSLFAEVRQECRAGTHLRSLSPTLDQIVRGKGAIECAAIRDFVQSGRVGPGSTVFKVTGRLMLGNADRCLSTVPPDAVMARMTMNREYMDTRLVGATAATWSDLLKTTELLVNDDDGRIVERMWAGEVARRVAWGDWTLIPFAVRPQIVGTSGTSGRVYSPRPLSWVTDRVERTLRTVGARKQT